jgi:hypothetical protein
VATDSPTQNSPGGQTVTVGGTTYTVGGGGDTTQSPLGVPQGYTPPYGTRTESTDFTHGSPILKMFPGIKGSPITAYGTTPNSSQYMSGDQWKVPLSDPESIPQLQLALVQAGLLSARTIRYGTWDVTSANAFAQVLGFANAYGLNAKQALDVLASNPKANAAGGAGPTISFTNPQDVATGFQNVSQNLTGQEQPVGDFQNYFHGQEAAAQHQTGQDYTQGPSVTGAATQYIQQHDPSQELAYGTASRMQEFLAMLGGSVR